MPDSIAERPKKLQRISQACDLCHRRSIRCRPSGENPQQQCQNCYDFAVDCTYNRPSRRRRNQTGNQVSPPNLLPYRQNQSPGVKSEGQQSLQNGSVADAADYTGAYMTVREGRPEDLLGVAWRSFAASSSTTIERCLEIYMDVVYPIFPLFHGPSLWSRIRKRHHLADRGFFASVMAACALAAARARDGATGESQDEYVENSSEIFFSAAQDAIFKDLTVATGLGYLRACALLALTSIQYGQITMMHQYMGHYHTLSSMQHFHEEERWPSNLPVEEIEERRRLYWAMYCWDIYSSAVFSTIPKSQETYSKVSYPSEINDEELTSAVQTPNDHTNWLRGFNFATDLYRVLEHAMKRLRRNQESRADRVSIVRMMISDGIPDVQVMENLTSLYYQLPQRFKDYKVPVTGDKSQDIFGFQAANIQATLQLVRITLFETRSTHDVHQKCDVAEAVLQTFHSIEPHYLRAISTPLVYHLGGIGQILSSVMQGILKEDSYQRVRGLLVSMADLLEGLESGLQPAAGASKGLRSQIDKIDQFMNVQREMLSSFSTNSSISQLPQQPQHPPTLRSMPETGLNLLRSTANSNGLQPIMNELGMKTPLDEFQLPPDVIGEWPWPFDLTQETGIPMLNGFQDDHQQHQQQHRHQHQQR